MEEIVLVVDDDASVRTGLARLLRAAGFAVETFASGAELLAQDLCPGVGCILLDVRMPEIDGMDLQRRLVAQGIDLPIVFLTGHGDIPMSVEAMKKGAFDFLTKPVDEDLLVAAVRQALHRNRQARSERRELQEVKARLESLTPREHEVLRCVIAGALNKQIAAYLGIAEKTVKIHRGKVMRKLGLSTLAELVQVCQRAGVAPRSDVRRSGLQRDSGIP